ncbi:PAS domain S-box protein [Rhizobium sp. P32RR-XVIII]|uniref:PAS domain S-box protein n=1 Tax=Rhizobium sp. P32RR-XVIII TaxID=2726738 RepID=UPI001456C694|nr:PAS domain S-box protein [Rhizobium sp. P32RR-XVIII]NLS06253.1 PAS domain S-box protein [Rhizobium sp. P32RR-XVIII]
MSQWPNCLHSALDIMLPSQAQIVMFWGPEFVAFYNDSYAPTIGDKHPHAFGRPAREYWSELWDDLEPLLKRVLENGETVAAKDRPFYIERHGFPETVYFDISYSPVRNEHKAVRGVLCIVNETTERVNADAAVRESEERLRAIFSQSAAGIALGEPTGELVSVNQRFCDIVGHPAEQLIGTRMQDITYRDDLPEHARLFGRLVETGESFNIEKRYIRGDGSLIWVADSVSAIRDEQGRISKAVAITIDITERKRTQEVERHLASMIASSNDAILGIDLEMTITSWNAAAARLYGYSEEEVIGQSVLTLVPDDRKDEEPSILRQIKAGLVVEPYETKRTRKDGRQVDVLLSVSPILDASGKVIGASKVAHDISARKEAERLQAMLAGELSHRVKNILAAVAAIARQTIGRDAANKKDVEAFLARLTSLGRAQDLLLNGDWQHADLRTVVEQAISPYPGERFRVEGPSVSLPPKAVVSLSLALHELATNAAKYGALSASTGLVSIDWQHDKSVNAVLRLRWKEEGGPDVLPPATKGFGSRLIERLLAAELKGSCEITFNRNGVECVIAANLAQIADDFAPHR